MAKKKKEIGRVEAYLGVATVNGKILKEGSKSDNEINSIELSKIMNTTSAQVRKDLSTFGEFGVRGRGYDVSKLIEIIEGILGINVVNNIIVVGHGKMGEMIASNSKVLGKGFKIVGIFDKDPNKIGKEVLDHLVVQDVENIGEFLKDTTLKVETAILAVVKEQAQIAANNLIKNGIKAILNMTTYKLEVDDNITVINMDISAKLQELNFWRILNSINIEEETE